VCISRQSKWWQFLSFSILALVAGCWPGMLSKIEDKVNKISTQAEQNWFWYEVLFLGGEVVNPEAGSPENNIYHGSVCVATMLYRRCHLNDIYIIVVINIINIILTMIYLLSSPSFIHHSSIIHPSFSSSLSPWGLLESRDMQPP